MFDVMDKNGRIIRITAEFYVGKGDGAVKMNSTLTAEETLAALLDKLPEGEILRRSPLRPQETVQAEYRR